MIMLPVSVQFILQILIICCQNYTKDIKNNSQNLLIPHTFIFPLNKHILPQPLHSDIQHFQRKRKIHADRIRIHEHLSI